MTILPLAIFSWLYSNQFILLAMKLLSIGTILLNVSILQMFDSISSIPDSSIVSKFMIALTLVLIAIIPFPVLHKGIVSIAMLA